MNTDINREIAEAMGWMQTGNLPDEWKRPDGSLTYDRHMQFDKSVDVLIAGPETSLREAGWTLTVELSDEAHRQCVAEWLPSDADDKRLSGSDHGMNPLFIGDALTEAPSACSRRTERHKCAERVVESRAVPSMTTEDHQPGAADDRIDLQLLRSLAEGFSIAHLHAQIHRTGEGCCCPCSRCPQHHEEPAHVE